MEDLAEDDVDVDDTRRDPADRLNSLDFTIADGFAGIPRWIIGFGFAFNFGFLFDEVMVVSGERAILRHVREGWYLYGNLY